MLLLFHIKYSMFQKYQDKFKVWIFFIIVFGTDVTDCTGSIWSMINQEVLIYHTEQPFSKEGKKMKHKQLTSKIIECAFKLTLERRLILKEKYST